MRLTFLILLSFLILFISCSQENNLFEITNSKDLLSLAESTNLKPINNKTTPILTLNEKLNKNHIYKNIDTLYQNKNFIAIIILSQKKTSKHYNFLLRTINKLNSKIIDTFLIASYNENSKDLCTGFVTQKLQLKCSCKSVNFTTEKQIDTFGKITQVNY